MTAGRTDAARPRPASAELARLLLCVGAALLGAVLWLVVIEAAAARQGVERPASIACTSGGDGRSVARVPPPPLP